MNIYQKICTSFLVFLFIYWSILHITGTKAGIYNFIYSFLFSLIPLIVGLVGMVKSKVWGGLKSHVGKAIFFLSLGLFAWGAGSMGWSYYNIVLNIAAPYPSLADLGFAPSIFFYGLGAIYLSRVTGAKYGLRNKFGKFFLFTSIILIPVISYYLLVVVARGGVVVPQGETLLKTILDIAYPLGDFVALAVSVIVSGLSFRYLGGEYLESIIAILAGLGVMFLADTIFSYTTTVGTFYNGDNGDLMLTIGLYLLALGVLGFCEKPKFMKIDEH
jgi:hypothetical protein